MPKNLTTLFLLSFFLLLGLFSVSPVTGAEKQVRVIVDKAPIYAENNTYSYKIEIVKRGTILTVYETGAPMKEWFYVRFHSQRWKSVVTGFIQASMIEEVTDKSKEEPEEVPKVEKIEPKPKAEITEPKAKEEKEKIEEEPLKISVEEILVASSLLPQKLITLPKIEERQIEPRVFMVAAPQREQITEDVQPKTEKPESKPAEIIPEEELFVEIESVGITPIPSSTSYALPKVEAKKDSAEFMSIERKPVSTESTQRQAKSVADIAKKIPEKLEERQPPEKTIPQPEAEKKEEAAKKTEEPEEKKPEQKQITPQTATEEPPRPKRPKLPSELSLLTFSLGFGPSGGSGLGGFVQLNTKMGFSLHLGAGYYPTSYYYSDYDWVTNKVLYSFGLKYYLPFKTNAIRTYMDLQYGGVSVEAVQIITGIWHYQYIYENVQKTLYGPSILAGIELKLGSIGLNGAIGLSYNLTDWDYWERDYFLTADVGLLIFLW